VEVASGLANRSSKTAGLSVARKLRIVGVTSETPQSLSSAQK
jgi:hypothetical protein